MNSFDQIKKIDVKYNQKIKMIHVRKMMWSLSPYKSLQRKKSQFGILKF